MSYQVIARRWRPQTFADVVGQDHITRTLKNALKQGRLAHAFLFTGPRGVGKTSTARILARAINCTEIDLKGDAEPCNQCETCLALLEDRELDVIEMDAVSYTGVNDIRKINEVARLAPVAGQKKIFIIDEVHMLSTSAFNAFLKTLEEPPEHVIFILATTDVHKVPITIRSRVQRFDFRPLNAAEIAPHLKKICEADNWPADEEALWTISRQADGSLRDAEGMLDQVVSFSGGSVRIEETREVLGILSESLLAQATRIVASRVIEEIPGYFELLSTTGVDYSMLLRDLQRYWTDLVFLKQGLEVTGRSDEEIETQTHAAEGLEVEDLFRLVRLASKLEDEIKWSVVPRVRFEVAFLRWANLDRAVSIRELLSGSTGVAPASPPAPRKSTPAPSKPKTKQEPTSPPKATPATETLDLKTLEERWPEIVAQLAKSKPAAAAHAEGEWTLTSLKEKNLTISPAKTGDFRAKQLKEAFPALTEVIEKVTGHKLSLTAGKPKISDKSAAPKPTPKSKSTGGDLFSSVMDQFGGEEVTGKQIKEPE